MKPSDEFIKLCCLNLPSDRLRAVRWSMDLSSDGWNSKMNMKEIGHREKHPSSVYNTLKRCAFEFNIVNASRTSRTLEGLLDPISKNFNSKISNQQKNGMKPSDELYKHHSLNHPSDRLRAVRWTKNILSDGWNSKAIIYNNNPVKQQLK